MGEVSSKNLRFFNEISTRVARDVRGGCEECHGHDAHWFHAGAQGTAARHARASGHTVWVEVHYASALRASYEVLEGNVYECWGCKRTITATQEYTIDHETNTVWHRECHTAGKVKELSAAAKKGKCYRHRDGERVEVVAVAIHRSPAIDLVTMLARKMFVVFEHGSNQVSCETLHEWLAGGWKEISRAEFTAGEGHVWSHTQGPWAIVVPFTKNMGENWKVTSGDQVHVVKCCIPQDDPFPETPDAEVLRVTVRVGKVGARMLIPLDKKVYTYRQDARAAKTRWLEEHGVSRFTQRDHYGGD